MANAKLPSMKPMGVKSPVVKANPGGFPGVKSTQSKPATGAKANSGR